MACSHASQQTEGLIIKPLELDIVIDKILEHLPIHKAAQTSVLSKQWRRNWLSLKSLVFNAHFRDRLNYKKDKWSKIISSVLLCHKGPVDYFELHSYEDSKTDCITHNHWLSFLSKSGVKKILISNYYDALNISSNIFCCSELVHLKLNKFSMYRPPTDFCGYRSLKLLYLVNVRFSQENTFLSLVANCSMLASLRLVHCDGIGIKDIVIDVPSLKTLMIRDVEFQSIAFRNVHSLEYISLYFIILRPKIVELIDAENLAKSSQLQSIEVDGCLCKVISEMSHTYLFRFSLYAVEYIFVLLRNHSFRCRCKSLVAGGILGSLPVIFNYLKKLSLTCLNLNDFGVFGYVLHMLESCPYITTLHISVSSEKESEQRELDYNYSHKLAHLLEIKIDSITGSSAELKLIEHLFAISVVLEKLSFTYRRGCESQLKIAKALMEFPRASPKARLCLDP